MTTKEITEFLENEGFYDKEQDKVQIIVTIEELRFIVSGLYYLKEMYEKDSKEYKDVVEDKDISDLTKDIKFVESLHSDLVETLYYQTDK